jgi:hypothetical protein
LSPGLIRLTRRNSVAPDFATSSMSHYDWQGGFIGDTANRPVDRHDSNGWN